MTEQRPQTGGIEIQVDVVFDAPPGPESGRFIEVEDAAGRGLSVGEWIEDGSLWRLRIEALTSDELMKLREIAYRQPVICRACERNDHVCSRHGWPGLTDETRCDCTCGGAFARRLQRDLRALLEPKTVA